MTKYLELTRDVMNAIHRRQHKEENSPSNPTAPATLHTPVSPLDQSRYSDRWETEEEVGEP
jgi:hypothetical protein